MAENPPPEKRKRVASHRLANEDNDGEVILTTHQNARAHAIEEEQHKRAAQLAQMTKRVQAKSGSTNFVVTPDLTAPTFPALTSSTTTPGLINTGSESVQ